MISVNCPERGGSNWSSTPSAWRNADRPDPRRVASFFPSPGVPTSGKVFAFFVPLLDRAARPLQSQTRSRWKKPLEFRSIRSPFSGHESFVRIKRGGRKESRRLAESISKKKFSAALCGTPRSQRLILPRNQKRWGPIGLAGLGGPHMRSPEELGSIVLQEKIHRPPWATRRPTSIEHPSLRPATSHQDQRTAPL